MSTHTVNNSSTRPNARAGGYLYGDSSPAPFRENYLDFVQAVVRCATEASQALQQAGGYVEQNAASDRQLAQELSRLVTLEHDLLARLAVEQHPKDSVVATCSGQLASAIQGSVKEAAARASADARQRAAFVGEALREQRQRFLQTLAELFKAHNPVDWHARTSVALDAAGCNRVSRRLHTEAGLSVTMDMVGAEWLSEPLRVGSLVDHVEIQVPEMRGWLRKSVTWTPYRVDRHYVSQLVDDGATLSVALTNSPRNATPSLELVFEADGSIRMIPKSEAGEAIGEDGVHVTDASDSFALRSVRDALRAHLTQSNSTRYWRMNGATIDGKSLLEYAQPAEFMARLIKEMAPTVREVVARSPQRTELVVKRVLDGGRREELFVSREQLNFAVANAPPALHEAFRSWAVAEDANKQGDGGLAPLERTSSGVRLRVAPHNAQDTVRSAVAVG